jgi:hypothetical protein
MVIKTPFLLNLLIRLKIISNGESGKKLDLIGKKHNNK